LLATPLRAFDVSLDVTIPDGASAAVPLRLGVWSPWSRAGYFLLFASPANSIGTELLARGLPGKTLEAGQVTRTKSLGSYVPGQPYHVEISVNKSQAITAIVSGGAGHASDSVIAADAPALFASRSLALTASAMTIRGGVNARLTNYTLVLPHQRFWANKVSDRTERFALIALLFIGALLAGTAAAGWLLGRIRFGFNWAVVHRVQRLSTQVRSHGGLVASLAVAGVIYAVGNGLLFSLGGQPFDMGNEKLYAYVARIYGPVNLYYLPNVVSLAKIWGGIPYVEAAFPYEPVIAYLFTGIAWLYSVIIAGGGLFVMDRGLEYAIKTVNIVFGLADSILIYLILRELKVSERRSRIGAALFLFNPAVWFSMSVWGQTHVFSLFFVLAAIWFAERRLPVWAWLALAAACLTRPQMLVFALLLGVVFLWKFSGKQNLLAVSWTVVLTFLLLGPLMLATSPSLPVDIFLNNLRIQEAGGNEVALTTVSQDAYSIWPLITYLAHGASSLQRAFTPSSTSLAGPITYQRLSQFLTGGAILLVAGVLIVRRRSTNDDGEYIPFVAVGITAFLMLATGVVATHFLLAIPLLILCRRWIGTVPYIYIVLTWTVTTFVPMFGDMGIVISSIDYPVLAPTHNAITRFVVQLYSWDRFITVSVVGNACAVIWLVFLALRTGNPANRPRLAIAIAETPTIASGPVK
jgi:hypothetical protein